jgi:hypothetical protein
VNGSHGSAPDGEVIGVLMSGNASEGSRNTSKVMRCRTSVSVDPEYDGGGVRAQDALQRAHRDAVVAAQRDGYAAGGSLPVSKCKQAL